MRDGRAEDRRTRSDARGIAPRSFDWDLSANLIRASSHPCCTTGRIHDLHPNASLILKNPLASRAPSIHASLEFAAKKKRTKRDVFLGEMAGVVPWAELEALIEPHYPKMGATPARGTSALRKPRACCGR